MDSLNDLIWTPEDEDLLNPNGIIHGCNMRTICIVAFCPVAGGSLYNGSQCGDKPTPPDPNETSSRC